MRPADRPHHPSAARPGRYAAADAQLKQKAEARREIEDLIFDYADDPDAPHAKRAAAEDAERWLEDFERLSLKALEAKLRELRAM